MTERYDHEIQKLELVYAMKITCKNCDALDVEYNKGLEIKIHGNCSRNKASHFIDPVPVDSNPHYADEPIIQ
jgi:hypothetical protein